jgi:hypothetical protein
VLGLVLRLCPVQGRAELVLDDTLSRHKGKNIALATVHADPLLRQGGRPFSSYGHVFVVVAVHVWLPGLGPTGWALPVTFRLFEGSRQGGQTDSPSDRKRASQRRRQGKRVRRRQRLTDREVAEGAVRPCSAKPDTGPLPDELRPTKLQLAAQMLLLVAKQFPHRRFVVLADHLYCGAGVLRTVLEQVTNVSFIVRGRPDAALYALPPARRHGQRGRPRVLGPRLPSPRCWAAKHPTAFELVTVSMYGKQVPVLLASFVGMAYRTLPGRLVRYVVVKDPEGIYKTDYLLCTEVSLPAAQVLTSYTHRWPLERSFQDCKQKLGIQDHQAQLPAAVRRNAPFGMLLYSLVVLWYLVHGHQLAAQHAIEPDPWYRKTARPSFAEMLGTLRRLSWAEAFSDPPSGDPTQPLSPPLCHPTKQAALADYVARVVVVT